MASYRCEELAFETVRADYMGAAEPVTGIGRIGGANTDGTPTGASAEVYTAPTGVGKVAVQVLSIGGQIYATKGKGTVTATAANGKFIDTAGFAVFVLSPGEKIAVITASLA